MIDFQALGRYSPFLSGAQGRRDLVQSHLKAISWHVLFSSFFPGRNRKWLVNVVLSVIRHCFYNVTYTQLEENAKITFFESVVWVVSFVQSEFNLQSYIAKNTLPRTAF